MEIKRKHLIDLVVKNRFTLAWPDDFPIAACHIMFYSLLLLFFFFYLLVPSNALNIMLVNGTLMLRSTDFFLSFFLSLPQFLRTDWWHSYPEDKPRLGHFSTAVAGQRECGGQTVAQTGCEEQQQGGHVWVAPRPLPSPALQRDFYALPTLNS